MNLHPYRAIILIVFILMTSIAAVRAQAGWDAYIARYDDGLGSVLLDMNLRQSTPRKDLPYLVVTGVTCRDCQGDGFPVHREFKRLYRISRDINRLISE